MINSVSRIMASNYKNNSKANTTNFKGIRQDFTRAKGPKSLDEVAYGPGPGLFSSLLSFLNPFNHIGSSSGSITKKSAPIDIFR